MKYHVMRMSNCKILSGSFKKKLFEIVGIEEIVTSEFLQLPVLKSSQTRVGEISLIMMNTKSPGWCYDQDLAVTWHYVVFALSLSHFQEHTLSN